jgi:hypothetical protein
MSQPRGISVATALRHRAFFTLGDSAGQFSAGPDDLGDWSMIGGGDIYVARANIGLVIHDLSPARSPNLTIARSLDTLLQTLPSAGAAALENQPRLIAAVSVDPQDPVVGDRVRVVATDRNGRLLPTLCFAAPPEVRVLSQLEDPHITFEARRSGTAQIEIHAYDEKTLTMNSSQLQLRIRPR